MQIFYSPLFKRLYKKLDRKIKVLAEEKVELFKKNPFDPRLRTHKLSGVMDGLWAFWIDRKNRISFEFQTGNVVHFHKVGNHDIYD